ncbi:helicase HerA domain-containing protein [Ilumatobacter sp.]|uniref:helicase HerA domain-containing protein n=1 Tax=Ilumatobacter sp. TaxID=1967498 RepID=UPI003B52895D
MPELFLGGSIDPATHERTTDDATSHVRIDTEDLTTHAVIVGMTGSGKTGLGVVAIEEALRSGVPVLAIDPKGDLTNLCLTFPDLAPGDFRPWIDEAQARGAGRTPDEFAADQAGLWTDGLAGWGLSGADIGGLRSAADVTIYTPGSAAGVPVNIVGSLQVPADSGDAEVVGDEIEGYVTGLLGLVDVDADPLSSREHILLSNLIAHSWADGRELDLMTLVGMIATPPIRKLGVFELDRFFPPDDRMELAMRLNGLLASPSFAAWAAGPPLDIDSMLFRDGRPRCAIVTTAHLSDDERQFVTSLILSKLVTWMRRQSGTSDLRAMLYMDEVAGYLPPSAMPPTKKPIMLLMKQARAFGVGVVLSTQNPVDVDYKAISNAGTWMIGRLQTDNDKRRLLDGMTSAAGDVDVAAIDATISGLARREFVLRRAGEDRPEPFTTRWAMSYLRGPMTRDQIERSMDDRRVESETAAAPAASSGVLGAATPVPGEPTAEPELADDESAMMPDVADGTPVRWVDPAAPWLAEVGGDERGRTMAAAAVARVSLRYDETKADLVHDDEFECVVFPLGEQFDADAMTPVDHDERDLRPSAPDGVAYRMCDAKIATKTYWSSLGRSIRDELVRTSTIEVATNDELDLHGRPGESDDDFARRCRERADELADAEIAKLRDGYETKAKRLRDRIADADDRIDVLEEQSSAKRNSELLSTAGSVIGGLLGGRRSKGGLLGSVLGQAGSAARRRGSTRAASERVDAAENKLARLRDDLADLEAELVDEVAEIGGRWDVAAEGTSTLEVGLESSDVKITQLALAWIPTT